MQNYKLLPALRSILETQNLTQSAQDLNVTQSAMSKTFRQIKEEFNDPIMVREGNKYILTSKGEELQAKLPRLLSQMDSLFEPVMVDPMQFNRKFTLAFSSFVAKSVLPLICSQVESQAPNVSIMSQYWQEEHLDPLALSEVDIVATVADDIPENLYGKELAQDQHVVLFSKHHPLANQELSLDSYLSAKHILVNGAVDRRRQLKAKEYIDASKRKVFAHAPSFHSAVKVILNTETIMTAPLHIASKYVEIYQLEIRSFPTNLPPHRYYLLWHAKYHRDQEHRWFRELCFQLLQESLQQKIDSGKVYLQENSHNPN
ncbi:LysR family transcriptional regulator [uncultured Shewanella sp.]|uniref:LysR family transcriptional regulator n=1 Tax=Shewanella atlantica TaxID=271099 RepID=UPI002609ACBF|nr:LysR family transcriptional regulator [uncultured Shewanella sp.]